MNNIIDDGEKLLGDLSGYARVASLARQLKQDLITWRKDKFLDWCQDTSRAIDDPSQALRFGSFSQGANEKEVALLLALRPVVA